MIVSNPERVKQRAAGRAIARATIELIEEAIAVPNNEHREAFWEELLEWVDKQRTDTLKTEKNAYQRGPKTPYSDAECRLFLDSRMPFGKYKGELCSTIPLKYFDYMVGKDQHFMDGRAVRFLKNKDILNIIVRYWSTGKSFK